VKFRLGTRKHEPHEVWIGNDDLAYLSALLAARRGHWVDAREHAHTRRDLDNAARHLAFRLQRLQFDTVADGQRVFLMFAAGQPAGCLAHIRVVFGLHGEEPAVRLDH
jgi:hypothetical protein